MRSNNQQENKALTPMQKQAVLVCIVCALAALLTIGITYYAQIGKNPAGTARILPLLPHAPLGKGRRKVLVSS